MLHISSSSDFNRSNPKQAPCDNQRSKRNTYIPLKKMNKFGLKLHIKNILNENNAKVYILYKIIQGTISTREVFVRVELRIFIAKHMPYSPLKRDCHKEIPAKIKINIFLLNIFQKQIIS
jgi:hypothetical protein